MAKITDFANDVVGPDGAVLRQGSPWRKDLLPASFRSAFFHVETNTKENGRRIVVHEFPKKDNPYSEDMGRRAYEFSVRGYCITYPHDVAGPTTADLYRRDYRIARDKLEAELSKGEPGVLQLPTFRPSITVVCPRWRLTEEQRSGGYCVFDMQFVELGIKLGPVVPDARMTLVQATEATRQQNVTVVDEGVATFAY